MDKYVATANTNELGLTRGTKYILENPKTGSVYVYNNRGKYLTYCRKDNFDDWKPVDVKLRKRGNKMEPNIKGERIEELNIQYKRACLDGTKTGLNTMINNFIDDESITSDYKQKIINMIVMLLTLNRSHS